MKKRIVIAGFGDTGLLTAIHLDKSFDIVGISSKPCLLSGQELGARLTKPAQWRKNYLMPYARYKQLDKVRTLQGVITHIDVNDRQIHIHLANGQAHIEAYDVLLIASGVTNGFWRNNAMESLESINRNIDAQAAQLSSANTIAIVGGGATGVSVAGNLAITYPHKDVHFFFSQNQPLPGYHLKVRNAIEKQLLKAGVKLHANHRADINDNLDRSTMTKNPIKWSTGQTAFNADLTLWAVGNTRPNNHFIPSDCLDESGYVKTDAQLRVQGKDNIFAVGDIAATDKNRSSARNWGYRLAAHNIQAYLRDDHSSMKTFDAPKHRWGSILGVQKDGLRVFQANGGSFRFSRWIVERLLFPLAVRRSLYRGVRAENKTD